MDHCYDRLVRVAYLVMTDSTEAGGDPDGPASIARAHRVVRRSLPWRPVGEADHLWLLARVLRRAGRPGRFSCPTPPRWGRPVPAGREPQWDRLFTALATLPAPVRAGYVLLMVERLSARDAVQVLYEAGWPDPVAQVVAAVTERQRLADAVGLTPRRQRELLTGPAADPTTVRLQAPDLRALRLARLGRRAAVVAIALVAATVLATATPQLGRYVPGHDPRSAGTPSGTPSDGEIRRVAEQAWTGAAQLTMASWPTRGDRVGDVQLVTAAHDAWLGLAELIDRDPRAEEAAYGSSPVDPDGTPVGLAVSTTAGVVTARAPRGVGLAPPVGAAQLLYAGKLPPGGPAASTAATSTAATSTAAGQSPDSPATVVALADATRIVVYRVAGASRSLRVEPAPAAEPQSASAIRISGHDEPVRYLVAPWVNGIETRTLADREPGGDRQSGGDRKPGRDQTPATGRWRPLPVVAGVTGPAPTGAAGCWSGPLLRLRATDVQSGQPYTLADLGRTTLSRLAHLPVGSDPGDPPQDPDAVGGAGLWSTLGCLIGELAGRGAASVLAWEIWSGPLPGTTHDVAIACLRAELPRDASLVAAVLLVPGAPARAVATAADTRLCSPLAPAVVVSWWWAAGGDRWHHVTVGGGPVTDIVVRIGGATARGDRMVVSAARPQGPIGPVSVAATDSAGQAVPVLG
ncbi:hypothetical protein ACN27F_11150 [Solwaraspora sp. WMMB335]|uniref:hypothetical protein n=1 Tax=Solwaraspora sp. WMMB335 TaxID=3404118 RepID=UPI003B92337A